MKHDDKPLKATDRLLRSLASVHAVGDPSGVPSGVAFLLSPGRAVTCAHVVNDALQRAQGDISPPHSDVLLTFPISKVSVEATVTFWDPPPPAIDEFGDIAILDLLEEVHLSDPLIDILECASSDKEHKIQCFGYPRGLSSGGQWAKGLVWGSLPTGLVQLGAKDADGPWVTSGYSGAPVYDRSCKAVIGMVVLANKKSTAARFASMIPSDRLLQALESLTFSSHRPEHGVWPATVDLGDVDDGCTYEATVHLGGGDDSSGWVMATTGGAAGGFHVSQQPSRIVLSPEVGHVGELRSLVTLQKGDTVVRLPVSADVRADSRRAERLPETMTLPEARALLGEWAAATRFVPDRLFETAFAVRDMSRLTASVTRVHVEHFGGDSESPNHPTMRPLDTTGERLGLPAGFRRTDDPKQRRGEGSRPPSDVDESFLIPDSVLDHPCTSCDPITHKTRCGWCSGKGYTECPSAMTCTACQGSGHAPPAAASAAGVQGLPPVQPNAFPLPESSLALNPFLGVGPSAGLARLGSQVAASCSQCQGRGTQTCPRCKGTGRRACWGGCTDGYQSCARCGGDGVYHSYSWVRVRRRAETQSFGIVSGDEPARASGVSLPVRLDIVDRDDSVPAERRTAYRRWLVEQDQKRPTTEVTRMIGLEFLAIYAVDYLDRQRMRTAYIVGEERAVHAKGARRPATALSGLARRWRRRATP